MKSPRNERTVALQFLLFYLPYMGVFSDTNPQDGQLNLECCQQRCRIVQTGMSSWVGNSVFSPMSWLQLAQCPVWNLGTSLCKKQRQEYSFYLRRRLLPQPPMARTQGSALSSHDSFPTASQVSSESYSPEGLILSKSRLRPLRSGVCQEESKKPKCHRPGILAGRLDLVIYKRNLCDILIRGQVQACVSLILLEKLPKDQRCGRRQDFKANQESSGEKQIHF